MAVTGSGTLSDPWIVHDWDEFLETAGGTLHSWDATQYVRFADFNINSNDEFVGSGIGTLENPYICNTYREMIKATGANYIYNLIRIKDPDNEGEYLFVYNGKYCRHDRTPSTIDISQTEYVSGHPAIDIKHNVDFNGWTIINLRMSNNANITTVSDGRMDGAIFLNLIGASTSSDPWYLFRRQGASTSTVSTGWYDSIIQVDLTSSNKSLGFTSTSFQNRFYRSSITIHAVIAIATNVYFYFGYGTTYNADIFNDCLVDIDINARAIGDGTYGAWFNNSRLTGILRAQGTVTSSFTGFRDSIIDFSYTGNPSTFGVSSSANINNIVNNDKVGSKWSVSNGFTKVDSDTLENPAELRALGFKIAVPLGGGS